MAGEMFSRWSQENYIKYMRQHDNIDRLVEYQVKKASLQEEIKGMSKEIAELKAKRKLIKKNITVAETGTETVFPVTNLRLVYDFVSK